MLEGETIEEKGLKMGRKKRECVKLNSDEDSYINMQGDNLNRVIALNIYDRRRERMGSWMKR